MTDDFAIFILTHGRPNKQLTLNTLKTAGYTGKWFLVVDDTDTTIQEYIDLYGADRIIVFNKNYYINSCETVSNKPNYACILYAKIATEQIAKDMGFGCYLLADDDIYQFRVREPDGDVLKSYRITSNIDDIIEACIEYVLSADIAMMSFSYMSVYMSGVHAFDYENFQKYRIPYIFLFRNPKFDIDWYADFPEDSLTAIREGRRGKVLLSLPNIQEDSVAPAKRNEGGMSATYATGTFNLVMRCTVAEPTITTPKYFKTQFVPHYARKRAFPKIISWRYRK